MRWLLCLNLLLVAWSVVFCCLLYLYADTCDFGYSQWLKGNSLIDTEVNNQTNSKVNVTTSLGGRTNIFFLKAHKCGSSTIQNILMRFGFERHLDFVLPEKNNYLGHPAAFNPMFISPVLRIPNHTYNVFTHHTRYNYTSIKAVMKPDTVFVTILREPSALFESLFSFYRMEKYVGNLTLKSVLKSPRLWPALHSRRGFRKFGTNQMAFDLGFNMKAGRADLVTEFIERIETEFDLVMITEFMEASLVLLCDLMNWPLEQAVFLQLNARPEGNVVELTASDRYALLELNLVDAELYDYFLARFKERVAGFGVERMKNSVEKLLELNSALWRDCINKPNRSGYAHTLGYELRNKDYICFFTTLNELAFTDLIRTEQIKRFTVMHKLDALLEELKF